MSQLRDNYKYKYISTATTTNVSVGQGQLIRIIVSETAAGTITIYDEAAGGTTTIIDVMKASIAENTYEFGVQYSKGIQIVTAGASKLCVVYAPISQ